jgi:hypothetical protein
VSLLALYLRSRQVALGALIAAACAVGLSLPDYDSPATTQLMALFAVAAVAAVAGTGLGTPDPDLDRTAALPWHWRRTTHVLAVAALAAGLGTLLGPSDVVARNAIGLTGLAALAVTLLGGGLAWALPLTWTAVVALIAVTVPEPGAPLLTWPIQPAGTTAATVAAVVLGIVGALAYALAGPRRTSG